jgi:hypothetical protein
MQHPTDPANVPLPRRHVRSFAPIALQYANDILPRAIEQATQYLALNPTREYARVNLRLFDRLATTITDKHGNPRTIYYFVHEAHYAPLIRVPPNPAIPYEAHKWNQFMYARDNLMWVLVSSDPAKRHGDGTGHGGGACSPFRDAQIRLSNQSLYLVDESKVMFDDQAQKYWYQINIRLYRVLPAEPFIAPHGYGMIPMLGTKHFARQSPTVPPDTTNPRRSKYDMTTPAREIETEHGMQRIRNNHAIPIYTRPTRQKQGKSKRPHVPVVDAPVDVPVDVPVDAPVVDAPVNVPVDAPVDAPVDVPVVDAPVNVPVVDAPVDESSHDVDVLATDVTA